MNKSNSQTIKIGAILVLVVVAALLVYFFALNKGRGDDSVIVIGVPTWESGFATAELLKSAIEKEDDFSSIEVRLEKGGDGLGVDNKDIYAGIESGSIDIHPQSWLPLHTNYYEQHPSLVKSDAFYNGYEGFCMIRDVAQRHGISFLDDIARFNGKIDFWVGDSGWSSTESAITRLGLYGIFK